MYKYETHLHTAPVSRCANASVEDTLKYYKSLNYDGVFITNHFLDGNIRLDGEYSYEEGVNLYFSDYEEGAVLGKELGIKVFCGIELSYKGTDFLIYGLDKEWCLAHPELMDMKTDKATNDCSSGSYEVTELSVTDEGVSCKFTFDGETPARSAVAVVIMKDENGKAVVTGTDAIKIKPNSEVKVEVPFENAENLTPTILLWDSLARLRPVGSK